MKLDGKVVIVTGASAGMGNAICKLFAKEGATVIAVARRKERLEELAAATEKEPGKVIPFAGDVSKLETNEEMIDFAVKNYGKLDVLINNAGIMDEFTPVGELTDELYNKIMAVNLYGPMAATRKAVNVFLKQEKGGVIVNVGSIGGLNGCRAGAAYTMSKYAMTGLTKNTAFMYAKNNIRCNGIAPGGVDTEVVVNCSHPSAFGMGRAQMVMAANVRMGASEEIATAALFLASDDSSFVNGDVLVVDGGWSAC